MAMLAKRRVRRYTYRRSSRGGSIKYIQFNQNSPLTVAVNGNSLAIWGQPGTGPAGWVTLGMTRTFTILKLEGHLCVSQGISTVIPNGAVLQHSTYAFGAYIDPDEVGSGLQPILNGNTSRWWFWRTGVLWTQLIGNGTVISSVDTSHNTHTYRFLRLTGRYKRKVDPQSDAVIFNINNSANSQAAIVHMYMFRMLVREA